MEGMKRISDLAGPGPDNSSLMDSGCEGGPADITATPFWERLTSEQRQRHLERISTAISPEEMARREEARAAAREAARLREEAGIRATYVAASGLLGHQGCTFEEFRLNAQAPAQREAYGRLQAWAGDLGNQAKGICLYGPSGRGKTHLARATGWAVMNTSPPRRVVYVPCGQLEILMKADRNRAAEDCPLLLRMAQADVLILDDLDKPLGGDAPGWLGSILKPVVGYAEENRSIRLVVTTNADPAAWAKHMPEWFYSRLFLLCDWLPVDGPNYRLRLAANAGLDVGGME